MRALVANRPSRVPTGLGNADTSIDMSVLLPTDFDDLTGSSEPPEKYESELEGAEAEAREGDILVVNADQGATRKHGAMDLAEDLKPQQAGPAAKKSKLTATTKTAKSKSVLDRYAEVAEQEELTAQKQAEAVKAKVSLAVVRAQAKAQIRLEKEKRETEKERRRTEYALRKLELEHQFRMAQLSHTDPHQASNSTQPTSYHLPPAGSDVTSSTSALPVLPQPDYSYPSTPHQSPFDSGESSSLQGGSHSTTFDFSGM